MARNPAPAANTISEIAHRAARKLLRRPARRGDRLAFEAGAAGAGGWKGALVDAATPVRDGIVVRSGNHGPGAGGFEAGAGWLGPLGADHFSGDHFSGDHFSGDHCSGDAAASLSGGRSYVVTS